MGHERLVKDTFLTLCALITFGLTNFVFNVVVGRIYGSEYLGIISTALSTSLLLSYVVSTSFPGAVSKYISEYLGRGEREKANYVLKMSLIYGVIILTIIVIFVFLFSEWLAQIFNVPETLLLTSTPIIVTYGIYMILKRAYYGYGKVYYYFKNEIFANFIFFVVLAIVIIFNLKNLLYLPYISLYFVFVILTLYFFKNYLKESVKDGALMRQVIIFASINFLGTFSAMSMRSLSIMISSIYVPQNQVGYLSAALALATIFFLFPNAIGRVFMPEFSHKFGRGENDKIITLLNQSTEYLAILVTVVNSLGITFSFLLISLFYSMEYRESILLLQIFLLGFWFTMVGRPATTVLSGTKYVHHPNIGGVLGLVAALGSWVYLIPNFGVLGTIWGYFLGILVNMTYIFFFAHKLFKFDCFIIVRHYIFVLLVFVVSTLSLKLETKILISIVILTIYVIIERKKIHHLMKVTKNIF